MTTRSPAISPRRAAQRTPVPKEGSGNQGEGGAKGERSSKQPAANSSAELPSWTSRAISLTRSALACVAGVVSSPPNRTAVATKGGSVPRPLVPDLTNRPPPRAAYHASFTRENAPASATASANVVVAAASPTPDEDSVNPLVGRRVLKPLGDTVCSGWVQGHVPAADGKEEVWVLHWDDDSEEDEEVSKSTLDKRLNLQSVKEREFPAKGTPKRRGRPRGSSPSKTISTPSSAKKTRSSRTNGAASPKPDSKKRSAAGSRAASAASAASTRKKSKSSSPKEEKSVLVGSRADIGTLVAKEFTAGVFTGHVSKVKPGPTPLWSISYEDGDVEELNREEMVKHMDLYKLLLAKYDSTRGRPVTASDAEGDSDESDAEKDDAASGTTKGKGKAGRKKKGASSGGAAAAGGKGAEVVGTFVRKFFEEVEEEYDGKVEKYFPEESDDDLGDLWLIKYDDGDSEHMNRKEIEAGSALYEKHYALQRKEVEIPANSALAGKRATNLSAKGSTVVLFAEKPKNSRLFAKVKNYRAYKAKG